jgi:DNA-binding IclR family transcriptional regulator
MDSSSRAADNDAATQSKLRSPARILNIIRILAESLDRGKNLSKISALLGAPKTSTFSLLRALCDEGYVQVKGTKYFLGDTAYSLASLIQAAQRKSIDLDQLPQVAEPFIRRLATETGETVFISALVDTKDEAVYIARAESNHPIRFMAEIGERRPLYSSSGGRALLAFMPTELQEAYLKSFKPRRTARNRVIDKRTLREMIHDIQATKIATTSDDIHVGVSAYSTPIFSSTGEAVAALIVAAPTERSEPKRDTIISLLGTCAAQLSSLLGHDPNDPA